MNQQQQQQQQQAKRILANESKAMDTIFNSNISKDYAKLGNNGRDGRILPTIGNSSPLDPNQQAGLFPPLKANSNGPPVEAMRRPGSQDNRGMDRQNSREQMLEAMKYQQLNFVADQSQKVDGIGRTLDHLIDKMADFQKLLDNESRRNRGYADIEREKIERLELALKVYEDNYNLGNSDLNQKFSLLESRLLREEKAKIELREKLNYSEQTQRELLEYVKTLQHQENHELIQMRSILQEKLTEDQTFAVKEKERSKTLFHEVVRLGEQHERTIEQLQTINMSLEARLQAMETKYQVNERALVSITEKGESGLMNLSDWNDKVERKVQAMESNLYALTREQIKDKEMINRLEAINTKLSDDLASLLNNLNSDYNQKLDARVTEMVNRIVMEHEERVRNHDDFKQQVDLRDQLNVERTQYEREEMRERYNAMDSLVRAEFERKDEALKMLHNIFETQVRALQSAIKQEELARNQYEGFLREEMGRFQDEVKKEFEGFRQQQTVTTEKLTEMIKIEIDTRLSSDIELKNQMNTIAHNISQDIETLRDNLETQLEATTKELRIVAADSAERANQLSRYIDQEVGNASQNFNTKYEKLKVLFAKFGEQFKNHLLNTEAFRKETLTKVQEIEQTIEFNKEEGRGQMVDLERRLDDKFRELKDLIAATIDNNNKVLDDKVSKMKEQLEGDYEVLKEAIDNSRTIFNNKFEKLMELNENYHKNVTGALNKVLNELETVKNNIFTLKDEISNVTGAFSEDVIELRGYLEVQLNNERAIRDQLIEETYEGLKKTQNDINSSLNLLRLADDKMVKLVDDLEKRYDDRFHSFSNQLSEAFVKLAGLNDNLANFEEKAHEDQIQLVSRMTADHLLLKSDNKIMLQELKKVVEVISKENTKSKGFQEKVTSFIITLSKESENVKNKVEKDVLQLVDSKIHAVLEKIKKEDQIQWEKTLVHVNNNFKDAAAMFSNVKIPASNKLHELVTQDDTYQKPVIKKGNEGASEPTAANRPTTTQNQQVPNNQPLQPQPVNQQIPKSQASQPQSVNQSINQGQTNNQPVPKNQAAQPQSGIQSVNQSQVQGSENKGKTSKR